jgi:ribosomal protein L1
MSMRDRAVERRVTLPDGRAALVRVGVPADSHVPQRELDTVTAEIVIGDEVAATVNIVLDADQESEALELAGEIAAGLDAGELEPTAGPI